MILLSDWGDLGLCGYFFTFISALCILVTLPISVLFCFKVTVKLAFNYMALFQTILLSPLRLSKNMNELSSSVWGDWLKEELVALEFSL